MNTKSIIEIFRGDDSDALGYQTIVGTIHTDLDLTGCKAVFRYLGFFQEFDPIPEDGKLTIVIPSASSMQFPPGFGYASLKVYDIDRKVRTFTNRIPVFVKTMTPCRGGGEFDVEFSPFPELEPLKIFKGPNADDFDQYTGFISKIIDRASAQKYGLSMLFDAMDAEKTAEGGCAASPAAVKAAYDAIIGVLADNYYTAEQTDEAIDRVAAYYITYTAAGAAFPTYAALANATTVYSGGKVRVPTRNDYCVVLADETHQGAEYRYIYAVAEGETTGSWQPQFPVEGVMTVDQTVTKDSTNPVASGGIWSAIWGSLTEPLPGFSSLYDWVASQLAGKASKSDATLTDRYETTWTMTPPTFENNTLEARWDENQHGWYAGFQSGDQFVSISAAIGDYDDSELTWFQGVDAPIEIRATNRVDTAKGYQLGSQSDKPLASEAEAEALRDGVAEANAQTEVIESKPNNPHLLADAFPITCTIDGVDYTIASNDDSRLEFAVGDSSSMLSVDSYGVCDFGSDNTFDYAWAQAENLKFNGRDPVEGVWPVLHFAASDVKVRDVSVLMKSAVIAPSTSSADSGKAADAKATGDALAGKLDKSGGEMTPTFSAPTISSGKVVFGADAAGPYIGIAYGQNVIMLRPSEVVLNDRNVALTAGMGYGGNLAALDADGNPVDSTIPAANVAVKGNIPYDRITITTGQLQDHAVQKVTLNAATTTLTLPALTDLTGKVSDFGIDVVNGYEVSGTPTAASFSLAGTIGTDYNLIVPEGEDWSEMSALAAGEMAVYYFSLSAFQINDKPTWEVMKKVVTLVPVPSAP